MLFSGHSVTFWFFSGAVLGAEEEAGHMEESWCVSIYEQLNMQDCDFCQFNLDLSLFKGMRIVFRES